MQVEFSVKLARVPQISSNFLIGCQKKNVQRETHFRYFFLCFDRNILNCFRVAFDTRILD